jgi:tol-pal system protein YbgF
VARAVAVVVISGLAPRSRPAPGAGGDGTAAAAPRPTDDGGSSVLADQDVEYGGDALSTSASPSGEGRRRARLHLSGSGRAVKMHLSLVASDGTKKKSSRSYRRALASMRDGKYEVAVAGFRRFLAGNPRPKRAEKAQYWIAECYYDQHNYAAAEPEFRQVIEKYPQGRMVPEAMLKLGFTLLGEGEKDSGRRVLESLAHGYPEHKAAHLASLRLGQPEEAPSRTQTRVLGTIVPPVMAATSGSRRVDAP